MFYVITAGADATLRTPYTPSRFFIISDSEYGTTLSASVNGLSYAGIVDAYAGGGGIPTYVDTLTEGN